MGGDGWIYINLRSNGASMVDGMIIKSKNFNIAQIAESGQCFRMNYIKDNTYCLVAYENYLELTQVDPETIRLSCSEEMYESVWANYFDMFYDYNGIVGRLARGEDPFLREAVTYGQGIRILRQEAFEAMISFIISQNKNIPAIKNCIEAICRHYGDAKIDPECGGITYYTFPTPQRLGAAREEELRGLGLGYRDRYVLSAAQAVSDGTILLENLVDCSFEEAVSVLKTIHGIGEKVANCIALFGLHHIEAFPVDVWIDRVLKEVYQGKFEKEKYSGYAGIVQQYMFYYARHRI